MTAKPLATLVKSEHVKGAILVERRAAELASIKEFADSLSDSARPSARRTKTRWSCCCGLSIAQMRLGRKRRGDHQRRSQSRLLSIRVESKLGHSFMTWLSTLKFYGSHPSLQLLVLLTLFLIIITRHLRLENEFRVRSWKELEQKTALSVAASKTAVSTLALVRESTALTAMEHDSLLLHKRRAVGVEVGLRRQLGKSELSCREQKVEVGRLNNLVAKIRYERDHLVRDFAKKLDQTGHIVYDLPEGRGKFVRKDVYESELVLQEQRLADGWLKLQAETAKRKTTELERLQLLNHAAAMEAVSTAAVAKRLEAVAEAAALERAKDLAIKEREAERTLKEDAISVASEVTTKMQHILRQRNNVRVQKTRLQKLKVKCDIPGISVQ